MLLYKLQFITPTASTRRALSARLVTGEQPDALFTRIRLHRQPDASDASTTRAPKSSI